MKWPFGHLQPYSYTLIMADPPWTFQLWGKHSEKTAAAQYDLMTLDDIKALPVGDLATQDAVLWLWATSPMLDQAIDTCRQWGFAFKTSGVWLKRTANGKLRWGTGYRLRSVHEPFIIGTVGNPKTPRNIPSAFDGLARQHSRKPEEAYALAEKMVPEGRRLELFSRQRRAGWDVFGNEMDKFEEAKN